MPIPVINQCGRTGRSGDGAMNIMPTLEVNRHADIMGKGLRSFSDSLAQKMFISAYSVVEARKKSPTKDGGTSRNTFAYTAMEDFTVVKSAAKTKIVSRQIQ